jgi:hypothetical protein
LKRALVLGHLALALLGCAGREPDAQAPIAHESPEDEILRVGRVWESGIAEKGFKTPPSRVTMFSRSITSTLKLDRGAPTAGEILVIEETFKVVDGGTYQCQVKANPRVTVAFGEHAGEAAIEVRRPPQELPRQCDHPGFPEPVLSLPATAARFALRGDRLIAFAPPTEARSYLPVP